MRYRKLSASGDYIFGEGKSEFYVNNPEAVAQAVRTRLLLFTGEWFLDLTEGMPYKEQVLGRGTLNLYDQAIKDRILTTQGVLSIVDYASVLDQNRNLTVAVVIETIYGTVRVVTVPSQLGTTFVLDESRLG